MHGKLGLMVLSGSAALAVLGCANQAQQAARATPSFVVTTPVAALRPGGKVTMYGTGFAPKQEITLVLKDSAGSMSSIGSSLKPVPVVNQEGAWAAEWDYSSFVRVIKPGTAMLTVSDKDFKPLGQAPIVFVAAAPAKPAPQAATKGGAPASARPVSNTRR